MANQTYGRARRSGAGSNVTGIVIALLALCGGGLLLHSTGVITLPFLSGETKAPPQEVDRRGQKRVVVAAKPIAAYSAVRLEHMALPKGGGFALMWMKESTIPEDMFTEPSQVIGRVLKHNHEQLRPFRESDFYPPGTREGPTAGIPAGKRAMRLRAGDIPGLHGLGQGDRFDIVMTTEVEVEEPRHNNRNRGDGLDVEGPYAPLHTAAQQPPPEAPKIKRRRAEVKLVVENGMVVQPVHNRTEITAKAASMFRSGGSQAKPVEELIIAVDPREVSQLEQALAIGAKIQVAMRGQPMDPDSTDESRIPDIAIEVQDLIDENAVATPEPPAERVRLVEVVEGGVKRLKAVPIGPEDGPAVAPAPSPEDEPADDSNDAEGEGNEEGAE